MIETRRRRFRHRRRRSRRRRNLDVLYQRRIEQLEPLALARWPDVCWRLGLLLAVAWFAAWAWLGFPLP